MTFSNLSHFIRLPNLLLSGVSLLLIFIIATKDFLLTINGETYLILSLETLTVLLIMAGGNMYNDLKDRETDLINRPETVIVGSVISEKQAHSWYKISTVVSLLFSILIYFISSNPWIVLYHILAIILLYYYSRVGKGTPGIGNLIVAFLCALIFPVVPLLFIDSLPPNWWHPDHKIGEIVLLFSVFSFFTTIWRELVKDVEDYLGDRKVGHKTLPVIWSSKQIKYLGSTFILIIFILLLYTTMSFFAKGEFFNFFYGIGLIISLLYLFIRFVRAGTKVEHHSLSRDLKLFIIQGLLLLLFLGS